EAGRPHLGGAQHHPNPASLEPARPFPRPLAGHAGPSTPRRRGHAPRPGPRPWRLGAAGGLARARGDGNLPHAGRAERAPALALLPEWARGVGRRPADTLPAGTDHAPAGADAVEEGRGDEGLSGRLTRGL